MYQTDFTGIVKDDGCLAFSIMDMVEEVLINKFGVQPKNFSKKDVKNLLHHSHQRGWVQKGLNDKSFGVYVMNHEEFANEVLSWHIQPHIWCRYLGAEYMPEENRESWGNPEGNDAIIIQVTTKNGGGHFRRLEYDPWYPSPGIKRIRSVRYYMFFRDKPKIEQPEVKVA